MSEEVRTLGDSQPADAPAERRAGGSRWRFVRLSSAAAALGIAAIALGFAWFANQVSLMKTPADPARADAIIVLTGGHSRLGAALELLKSGKGERLLISGVSTITRAGDLQYATGADAALFSCCVDIDRAALDTAGNAEESAKWIHAHAFDSVIVVTNNYHMPRSLLEMRRYLADAVLQPYPVVNSPMDDGAWITKPDAVRVLFTEYAKYLAATLRLLLVSSGHPAPEPAVVEARARHG